MLFNAIKECRMVPELKAEIDIKRFVWRLTREYSEVKQDNKDLASFWTRQGDNLQEFDQKYPDHHRPAFPPNQRPTLTPQAPEPPHPTAPLGPAPAPARRTLPAKPPLAPASSQQPPAPTMPRLPALAPPPAQAPSPALAPSPAPAPAQRPAPTPAPQRPAQTEPPHPALTPRPPAPALPQHVVGPPVPQKPRKLPQARPPLNKSRSPTPQYVNRFAKLNEERVEVDEDAEGSDEEYQAPPVDKGKKKAAPANPEEPQPSQTEKKRPKPECSKVVRKTPCQRCKTGKKTCYEQMGVGQACFPCAKVKMRCIPPSEDGSEPESTPLPPAPASTPLPPAAVKRVAPGPSGSKKKKVVKTPETIDGSDVEKVPTKPVKKKPAPEPAIKHKPAPSGSKKKDKKPEYVESSDEEDACKCFFFDLIVLFYFFNRFCQTFRRNRLRKNRHPFDRNRPPQVRKSGNTNPVTKKIAW